MILTFHKQDKEPKKNELPQPLQLQSLLQSLPEAVFLFDCRSHVLDVNAAAEKFSGSARSSLIGQAGELVLSRLGTRDEGNHGESAAGTILDRALRGEHVRHERYFLRRPSSPDNRETLVSGSPMFDTAGKIIGALLVMQDITELASLQREMASSERHFAVGQMTAGLAHDFNNVLNTISQAVTVMETQEQPDELSHRMLGIISNGVRRGSEIVSNMRNYLRGAREGNTRISALGLLNDTLMLIQPLLETRPDITVQRKLEEVPPVKGNAPELRRVFTNLILNAIDAMPHSGTLTLSCVSEGERVIVSIADNGAGMTPETQERIFSPYFTTKAKGTGLGLAGARRTIEAQGGEIRFVSKPGSGTTFFVSLPAEPVDHQPNRAA